MPARLGTSCTASFNSACCSPVSAGGNLLTDQMTVPGDHPPQTSWSIDLWCGHPGPTPELPPSPSIPGPAAISRATSPFPVASAPDTYAVVPQPHPSATVPAASPSPSCPTATPTPISSPNNSSTANSTQRQCGFHRGFGLVPVRLLGPNVVLLSASKRALLASSPLSTRTPPGRTFGLVSARVNVYLGVTGTWQCEFHRHA